MNNRQLNPLSSLLLFIGLSFLFSTSTYGQTNVSGNQSGTWNLAGSPYVMTGDVIIPTGETLVIEPGVTLKFGNTSVDLDVRGTLLAQGTDQDSIYFEGVAGENFNGERILFNYNTGGGTIFDRVVLDSLQGIDIQANISPTITRCRFRNCFRDIRALPYTVQNISQLQGAIIFIFNSPIGNSRFPVPGPDSYYLLENDLIIPQDDTLTIDPGVRIKFNDTNVDLDVRGILLAQGTDQDSIYFEGIAGENVNGERILFSYNTGGGTILDRVVLDSLQGVSIQANVSPTITRCRFRNCSRDIFSLPQSVENISQIPDATIYLFGSLSGNGRFPVPGLNSYYLLGNDLYIYQNDTLIIDPGVRLKFEDTNVDLNVQGTLLARGTDQDSIYFEGVAGENVNGERIQFYYNTGGGSILDRVVLDSLRGIDIQANVSPTITRCRFRNCSRDIFSFPQSVENISQIPDATIYLSGSLNGYGHLTVPGPNSYYLLENDLYIYQNDTLIIDPGVRIKFEDTNVDLNVQGTLLAQGTDQDSIYFEGVAGENINGERIQFYYNTGGGSIFDRVVLDSLRGIDIQANVSPTITRCRFRNCFRDIFSLPQSVGNISQVPDATIYLSGSLSGNGRLPVPGPNSYYLLENDLTIYQNDSLTIDPGVQIKFEDISVDFNIYGTLLAQGTDQDSIRFKGVMETTLSGERLRFYSTSSNSLLNKVVLDSLHGIYIDPGARPTVINSCFMNSTRDIDATLSSVLNIANNRYAAVYLRNENVTNNSIIPYPGEQSFYIVDQSLTIPQNITFDINPGALFLFPNNNVNISVYGTLNVLGTEESPIEFFHLPDVPITYGGSIYFYESSQNSELRHFRIDYLGDNDQALDIRTSSISITNMILTNAPANGMRVTANASPSIINSSILYNQRGVSVLSGAPTFFNSNIYGNTEYGIQNTGVDTVDARNCWWGDTSGPLQSTLNPVGLGNEVSDRVLFDPWLQKPINNEKTDIGIIKLVDPVSDCNLTATESVTVRVFNFGNISLSDFQVGYQLDGQTPVIEAVGPETVVVPGGFVDFTFGIPVDLSTPGSYPLAAFTQVAMDSITVNDTLTATIQHFAPLGTPENLIPSDGAVDLPQIVFFSWQSVVNATNYDFYIWPATDSKPVSPTVSGITQIGLTYSNSLLDFGATYNWQIIARNNSCATESPIQQFTVRELPDLTVSNIQLPIDPFSEQEIEVSWQVNNQGPGATGGDQWYDAVYLSQSDFFDGNEIFLGAHPNTTALGPGESYLQSTTLTLPRGIQGTYYLLVHTDKYTSVPEENENNNLAGNAMEVTLTPPPDLRVTSLITPNNAFSGQPISVDWTVTNEGPGPTQIVSWRDRIYLSDSPVFNPFLATLLKTVEHDNGNILPATGSYNRSESVTLPETVFGDHYLHVLTDINDQVYEFVFEDNNIATSSILNIILTPPPDLVVSNVVVPDSLSTGASFQVEWTVTNAGANTASAGWYDQFFLSQSPEDFAAENRISLGNYFRSQELAAGNSYTEQRNLTVPKDIQGRYYVFVETDYGKGVFEFNNEDNNVGNSDSLIVSPPDLGVAIVSAPATSQSGTTFDVNWSITNNGPGKLISAIFSDELFLSPVPFLDNSALSLGTFNNDLTLDIGESIIRQKTVTMPDGISGDFYLILQVDARDQVFEGGVESNNIISQVIEIQLAPYPDLQVTMIDEEPDTTMAGINFPIQFTVKNLGTATAEQSTWTDKIYVSNQPDWDPNTANLVGEIDRQQALPVDATYTLDTELSIPMLSSMFPGLDSFTNIYIYIYTDAGDKIYEHDLANENNISRSDTLFVFCPPPVDLVPLQAASNGSTLSSGDQVTVGWTVQNTGSTTEFWNYPFWYDGFFLSRDTVWDDSDIFIVDYTEPGPLGQNATYSDQKTFNLPFLASGSYYLLLVADHQNRNRDGDPSNNVFVIPFNGNVDPMTGQPEPVLITQSQFPDLRVNTFFAPATGTTGQPVTVNWEVANIGLAATSTSWIDRVYLSTDYKVDGNDLILGSRIRTASLNVNATYQETIDVNLPINMSGNYILLLKTDAANRIFEPLGEGNNLAAAPIFLEQPPPADLVVTEVVAPTMAMVNEVMDVSWTVRNQGLYPASGIQKDIVYLSVDSLWSPDDIRLGTKSMYSGLGPLSEEERTLSMTPTPGVPVGDYYLFVQTDAINNIYESDNDNNVGLAPEKITVTVPELPLETTVSTVLPNATNLYYRIEIPEALTGETLLVSIDGDPVNGRNELYLSYEASPSRAVHDFSFGDVLMGSQSLIVSSLEAGTYYLLAYGFNLDGEEQPLDLKAEIIEFQIRSVTAGRGGNTGSVTVKISGAKFTENMQLSLEQTGMGTIDATNLYFVDPTEVFATFDLSGTPIGMYDLTATTSTDTATLVNGFEIVPGAVGTFNGGSTVGGDGSGFYCSIENLGVGDLLSSNVQHPAQTRLNRIVPITIQYGNNGNVDVPVPQGCRIKETLICYALLHPRGRKPSGQL